MIKINKLIIIAFVIFGQLELFGQQDPMYSQYANNPMILNPAYAGTKEGFVMTGLIRMQWVGIDDAPKTQTFSIHSPVSKNMGLGLTAMNDKAGPLHQMMFYANYSYQVDIDFDSRLSFGLKAGFHVIDLDLTDKDAYQHNDPNIYNLTNYFVPNVGVGIYYYTYNFYLGVSAPRLLESSLDPRIVGQSTLVRHYFLTSGYIFDLDEIVKVKPNAVVKFTPNAPVSFDLGINLYHYRWGLGFVYRLQDALVGIFEFYANPQMSIGYAYDYTLSDLRHESSGSHEFMIRYDFSKRTKRCRPVKYF